MSQTDFLHLNDFKLFKCLRQGLSKDQDKTTNLICVKDGVLYAWDFANTCVLSLNLKAARSRDGDNVTHQTLLSLTPCLFQPENLAVNYQENLLIASGPSGVLVMELPTRFPPHGAFEYNKELVYCKSHSLDERLFLCSMVVKVVQVKFHPGSPKNNHIVVLTSDNKLRLYAIENGAASSLASYSMGEVPVGNFPGTKTSYLSAFGETAVAFDFGQPEIEEKITKTHHRKKETKNLLWPVYVLWGNGSVYNIYLPTDQSFKPKFRPIWKNTESEGMTEEACSIVCLNSTPEIVCVANSDGTIFNYLLLNSEHDEKRKTKELLCFEAVELDMEVSFLRKDQSKIGRYFVVHSAGIHAITITCLKDLQSYVAGEEDDANFDDIFHQECKTEYLLCTKISSTSNNKIVAFSPYYDPTSVIAILADGAVISLGLMTTDTLQPIENLIDNDVTLCDSMQSPLKQMLRFPFDQSIHDILRSTTNPILKLGPGEHSNKQCYELLQTAAPVFRELFENHNRAREEIEKRARALLLMKHSQLSDLERMRDEQRLLREKAEALAEKHEDIKDGQVAIAKRCEQLVVLVSQRKEEPSEAEKDFGDELRKFSGKVKTYKQSVDKLKLKANYQKVQIENWKAQEERKATRMGETHSFVIKESLEDMGKKITDMVKEVQDIKERLNLK